MKGRAVGAHNVRPRGGAARLKEERFARPFGLSPLTIKPPLPQIPNSSFLIPHFPFPSPPFSSAAAAMASWPRGRPSSLGETRRWVYTVKPSAVNAAVTASSR